VCPCSPPDVVAFVGFIDGAMVGDGIVPIVVIDGGIVRVVA